MEIDNTKLKECKNCGTWIHKDLKFCFQCGEELDSKEEVKENGRNIEN